MEGGNSAYPLGLPPVPRSSSIVEFQDNPETPTVIAGPGKDHSQRQRLFQYQYPGPVETGALLGPQALPAAAELAEDPETPPAPPARRSPGTEPRPDQPGHTPCRALPAP